jgi:hypothetical protein
LDFPWLELHPSSYVEHLYDIDSPDGKDVWAVGAYGLILHSPNGDDFYINSIPYDWGNNTVWNTQVPGFVNASLWKVFFTSPLNGYAVGDNGTILKYNLLEGAPEGADILGFAVSQQAGTSALDQQNLTVYAEVDPEADLTSLIPELFLSAGASCDPPSGQSQDFTYPVSYTVTSADGAITQIWTITVDYYTRIGEHGGLGAWGHGDVEVWPNPTSGVFSLQSSVFSLWSAVSGQQSAEFEILNLNGTCLKTWNPEPGTWNSGTVELDISHLPSGIYFIRINLENQLIVKKIIKF